MKNLMVNFTDIHPRMHPEEEEFDEEQNEEEQNEEELLGMEEDYEEEEEEVVPPEDEEEVIIMQAIEIFASPEQVMKCRGIRIGSYKIHRSQTSLIHVFLDPNSISFCAPTVREPYNIINVKLKTSDITHILVHFGRCLPVVFVYTTAAFGETLRKALRMVEGETPYFDPTSSDDQQEKITLLIHRVTDDLCRFFREVFPGEQKVKEIDQLTANEILIKSTPPPQV